MEENTVLFEIHTEIPKECLVSPIRSKTNAILTAIYNIVIILNTLAVLAVVCLNVGTNKYLWMMVLAVYILCDIFTFVIIPVKRRSIARKIIQEGENCFRYSFYRDRVAIKGRTVDATLTYDTAEFSVENNKYLVIMFPFSRSVVLYKLECTLPQLDFIRQIVNKDKQAAAYRKSAIKMGIRIAILTAVLGVIIYFITRALMIMGI